MKYIIISILFLSACSTLQSPNDKYYAATVATTKVSKVVERFIDTCKNELPIEDKCHEKLPAINAAAKALKSSIKQLDKVFVSGDSKYYDLTLSVTQNAVNDLKNLIGE